MTIKTVVLSQAGENTLLYLQFSNFSVILAVVYRLNTHQSDRYAVPHLFTTGNHISSLSVTTCNKGTHEKNSYISNRNRHRRRPFCG